MKLGIVTLFCGGVLLVQVATAAPPVAESVEGPDIEVPVGATLRSVQNFSSKKYGPVHVILRTDGETLGKPYLVDIRAACSRSVNRDWKKMNNSRMQSACMIEKEDITFSQDDEALVVRYQDFDADAYNRESKEPGGKAPEPKCRKRATVLKIKLEDLCATAPAAAPKSAVN